jgi:hypothetical protein
MLTNYQTKALSQRHFITAMFVLTDILSPQQIIILQIKGMLNSWKQAIPV